MFSIIADCASGSEYNFNTNVCDTCPRGYYRDKNDRLQYECQICDLNFITASTGATSSAACNVSKCCTVYTVSRLVGKPTMWLLNKSDTNRPVLSQKIAGDWIFWNKKVEELYYPCSENKGADQLRSYCEADLRLCFRICRLLRCVPLPEWTGMDLITGMDYRNGHLYVSLSTFHWVFEDRLA